MCVDFETELVEFNREGEHVHLLVNSLQGVSSHRMRTQFPDPTAHYRQANKPWSASSFTESIDGAPPSALRQHIEQQNRPA